MTKIKRVSHTTNRKDFAMLPAQRRLGGTVLLLDDM